MNDDEYLILLVEVRARNRVILSELERGDTESAQRLAIELMRLLGDELAFDAGLDPQERAEIERWIDVLERRQPERDDYEGDEDVQAAAEVVAALERALEQEMNDELAARRKRKRGT
jgi:hypothetical protein